MSTSTQWQLARDAAERYQNILTPSILGPFAEALVEFATLTQGESVLDVGCGTGAAARCAAQIVGDAGVVTAVDVNAGMLEVAKALPPLPGAQIAWREANATSLPVADQSVDAVLCAQTLQFLPDKSPALGEMRRVAKPDGRVAISLWCAIEENPYFAALVDGISTHIGPDVSAGLHAAFALTDARQIEQLLSDAGFPQIAFTHKQLDLTLPPLVDFVPHHVSATPMAAGFSRAESERQRQVVRFVSQRLGVAEDASVQVPFRSHMILAQK